MRNNNIYIADFETTTEQFYNKYGFTRVWACGVVKMSDSSVDFIGESIDDFIEWCQNNHKAKVFFHNLKFDGEFILSYILRNNFVYDDDLSSENSYSSIIDNFGTWYMLKVNFKGSVVTFYDSFKKLPFKVEELGKMLKLPEQKLVIDYDIERPDGYHMTEEEKQYLIHDCVIVSKALKSLFDKDMTCLTLSGDAQKFYKKLFPNPRQYEYTFPAISVEEDTEIRLSYKGGFVYCNNDFAGQIVEGCSFDVNSLYPYVLHECLLPMGSPIKYKGKYKEDKYFPLYIQHIMVDFKVKDGYLPSIQIKHSRFNESEYLTKSDGVVSLYLTKPDLELFLEHYDILFIKYIDGYKFNGSTKLFKTYVDYWYKEKADAKASGEPTRLMIAKLMLNSLYGRYGMGTMRVNKLAYLEDDIIHYELNKPTFVSPQYTALASFVTAYARCITIRASQSCYEKGIYLYSDTDSVHIKGYEPPQDMKIDDYELGAWKNEGNFVGKFIRPKTYIKLKHDKENKPYIDITCAGMPANIKNQIKELPNPLETFQIGYCSIGKLVPKRVKGGVILVNMTYTLKAN